MFLNENLEIWKEFKTTFCSVYELLPSCGCLLQLQINETTHFKFVSLFLSGERKYLFLHFHCLVQEIIFIYLFLHN